MRVMNVLNILAMKILKNIWIYYLLILLPLIILILSFKYYQFESVWFVLGILFYSTIYRTFIDGYRLYYKNIIDKKDIWKRLIPLWYSINYFKQLYLK